MILIGKLNSTCYSFQLYSNWFHCKRLIHSNLGIQRSALSNRLAATTIYRSYVSQRNVVPLYDRPDILIERGNGCYVWDKQGRRYLDFTSGISVNSLGHCDSEIGQIIAEQAATLIHTSNLYISEWPVRACETICTKTRQSGGMFNAHQAFFCNSGTEANEAALKFARKYAKIVSGNKDKFEIVAFENAFHGRTMGSLSATPNPKYQKPFTPLVPGYHFGKINELASLNLITQSTAAVIIEPIQGEGGICTVDETFLTELRQKCNEHQAVLIYDEIQCGMGRSGRLWVHSYFSPDAHPDILTTAKALGNGIPIGAMVINDKIAPHIQVGDHGTTFGGNPLATRVAVNCLERLSDPALHENVLKLSSLLVGHLNTLISTFPHLFTSVRGKGLMLGLQMTQSPLPLINLALQNGLLVIAAGHNTLRITPPLIVQPDQITDAINILHQCAKSLSSS